MAAGPRSATLHEVDIPATTSWEVRRLAAHLLPDAYEQLKRIARRVRGRASSEASIQTTVLVHESYLRLCASSGFVDNAHFLRASALAMRHALQQQDVPVAVQAACAHQFRREPVGAKARLRQPPCHAVSR